MRRTLFNLIIALLAFGIGTFVVLTNWTEGNRDEPFEAIPVEQTKTETKQEIKFECDDKMIKTVWEKLKKDKNFIKDAYSVIEAREIKNCRELFDEPQTVELNDDQSNEIILKGSYILFCGSGGDCRTWIVSKINDQYQIIFEGNAAESSESIKALRERNQRFQWLKIKLNNHWEADTFGIFRFDGKKYRINKCFKDVNSDYTYTENNPEKLVPAKLQECL